MEINKRLTNIFSGIPINNFPGWTDDEFCEYLLKLPYLKKKQQTNFYLLFKREVSENGYEHWQIYCEFNQQVYFRTLCRDFRFHVSARKESQRQAINYVKKQQTSVGETYERGTPKKATYTKRSEKIKKITDEELLKKIIKRMKKGKYQSFFSIEKEHPEYFQSKKLILKNIWNQYYQAQKSLPTRVFWIYGEKGTGKTTFTNKYLDEHDWEPEKRVELFPNNMTYNDRIFFDIEDEKGRVLIINEVDENFPKNNNLIAFIDRKVLDTNGSKIHNDFQLIIINSIYRPEEVFGYLGKRASGQILRRIFNPFFDCMVYEIKANEEQLKEIRANQKKFSQIEFQNWYQPIVQIIPEPDYSLIEKD